MKNKIWFFILLINSLCVAQSITNQEKIKKHLDSYFLEDREIIHVQFNKNSYLNNEDIAFTGYVLSRNNGIPHPFTSNVQLIVYNEKQEEVKKQLLFVTNGIFSGGIHLDKSFKKGKYIFHFYTNWMNNFKEDDSFSQTIEVFDIMEPFVFKNNQPNWNNPIIEFFPEGENIIDGINNTIGIKIVDCKNKGLEIKNATIFDSKSNEVGQFSTDKNGNGVISFFADINEKYTLKIDADGKKISQDLPIVKPSGIAISCNSNLPNNKFAISVKTNDQGVSLFQNKKLSLVIQQNSYFALKEIDFSNKENDQVIILDKSYLQEGVNSIRLIDDNLNEITERLIYNYSATKPKINLETKLMSNDTIVLSGTENLLKSARISLSILPEKSVCMDKTNSILGTFYLNAYLENPVNNNFIYFDSENKMKQREIDALLLNQKRSKFLWENIKSSPPVINYKFTKGVTISGKVENKLNKKLSNKLSLLSVKNNVFEQVEVEKDNTFKLDNFFVQDSTLFVLQVENERNTDMISKVVAKINDNQTKFNLPLKFKNIVCPETKNSTETITFAASKSSIALDEVIIKQKKKEVLIHSEGISAMAVAHKIDNLETGTILDFIGRNGYNTGLENGEAFVRSRRDAFQNGSPEIFLDNVFLFDFNALFDLDIDTADEIYIDKSGTSSTRINSTGVIKIFLKRGNDISFYTNKTSKFIATSGFTKNIEFKNAKYFTEKEFNAFGTLNWSNFKLKENEKLQIKFPKENQTFIQVFIQGFTEDGQILSEFRKIPINQI